MDVERVWNVTSLLRNRCLEGYPITVIDPASPKARSALVLDKDTHAFTAWLSSFRDSCPGIPTAIAHALKTPRALKPALRITLETWEKLRGEIDLDSVLVASVLRTAHPDLFALVSEHVELFRHGLTDPFTVSGEKKPHKVVERTGELLAGEDERTASSLRALLSYLFPKYPPDNANNDREYIARPQALFNNHHADYWRRYLAQIPVDEMVSDQDALASIAAWRVQQPSDIVDRIVDPERSDQIEQFVGQFHPEELCRLLNDVADQITPQSAAGWEQRSHAPGITPVWRMMLVRRPPEGSVFRIVSAIVKRAGPLNLPLANDVTYFFAANSAGVPNLIAEEERKDVTQALRGSLAEHFTGDGAENRLLQALKGGSPWLIFWVAGGVPPANGQSSAPFDWWPKFANVLLNLAKTHPAIAIPLVVPFITTSDRRVGHRQSEDGETKRVDEWVAQFDTDTAKRLFDFHRLIHILVTFEVPDYLDEQMKAHCRAAVEAGQRLVSTLQDSPPPSPADSRASSS